MIEDVKKASKYLTLFVFLIMLVVVGGTLAISYVMDSIDMNIGSSSLNVVYIGQNSIDLANVELLPIADSEVDTNTSNVMQID